MPPLLFGESPNGSRNNASVLHNSAFGFKLLLLRFWIARSKPAAGVDDAPPRERGHGFRKQSSGCARSVRSTGFCGDIAIANDFAFFE